MNRCSAFARGRRCATAALALLAMLIALLSQRQPAELAAAPAYDDPIAAPTPWPDGSGQWVAEYWANPDLAGTPALTREEAAIAYDWGLGRPTTRVPVDGFSARWQRQVDFTAGVYEFRFAYDDHARLWLDGALAVDAWNAPATADSILIEMSAGRRTLRYEMRDLSGPAQAALAWSRWIEQPEPTPTTPPYPAPPEPAPTRGDAYPAPTDQPTPTATPTSTPAPSPTPGVQRPEGTLYEAERGILTPPMGYGYDGSASGGWFVAAPEGSGEGRGAVTIPIRVRQAGRYVLYGRVRAPDVSSDSFWVTLAGQSEVVWNIPVRGDGEWVWVRLPLGEQDWPLGTVMLRIRSREDGAQLDAIVAERLP